MTDPVQKINPGPSMLQIPGSSSPGQPTLWTVPPDDDPPTSAPNAAPRPRRELGPVTSVLRSTRQSAGPRQAMAIITQPTEMSAADLSRIREFFVELDRLDLESAFEKKLAA